MDVEKAQAARVDEMSVYLESQRLAVAAAIAIGRAMELAGLRRSQVADALGLPKSRVTKVLDSETNMTLKTLAQFGLACGVRWQFVGVKADDPAVIITAPESLAGCDSPYIVQGSRVVTACDMVATEPSKDVSNYSLAA